MPGTTSGGGDGVGSDLAESGVIGLRGSDGVSGGRGDDADDDEEEPWRDLPAECGRRAADASGGDVGDRGD